MASPSASVSFSITLPTNPSHTTTSARPNGRSLASTFPMKFMPEAFRMPVASFTRRLPLPSSAPTLRRATLGFLTSSITRAITVPRAAKSASCRGRASTFVPRSMTTVFGAGPMMGPPRAARSMPSKVPSSTVAAAMEAPVEPMLTTAFASPSLSRRVATKMEAFRLDLNARAGCSFSPTTPSDSTMRSGRPSVSRPASSVSIALRSPTRSTSVPLRAASTAPATVCAGP